MNFKPFGYFGRQVNFSPDGAPGNPPPADTPATETPPENGGGDGKDKVDPPKTFTQEDVDRIVKERLEREQKKAEAAAKKAKEDAEAAALAKNAEWQKLAETHAARIKELEPLSEQVEQANTRAERFEKSLKAYLAGERAGLPAHILTLLDKMDVVEQLEYIAANREALGKPPAQGVTPTPKPGDPAAVTKEQNEKARKEFSNHVRRNFFS